MSGEYGIMIKDWKVILLVALVLLSLIAIHPHYSPSDGFSSNLHYGLDLEGGSWFQLGLQGAIVNVTPDAGSIVKHFVESGINDTVTITEVSPDTVKFTTNTIVSEKIINGLGLGNARIRRYDNYSVVTLDTDESILIRKYISNATDSEVTPVLYNNRHMYEIRGSVNKSKLEEILAAVNSSISIDNGEPQFFDSVSPETFELTMKILSDKINVLGLMDAPIRSIGDKFLLIDLAGVDISTARNIIGNPGKFEIRIQTVDNESAHVLYGDDISRVDIPQKADRSKYSPWGTPFQLSEVGAAKFREAAINYGAVDAPKAHNLIMLLDGKTIYDAPLSLDLAKSIKSSSVSSLVASTGVGDESLKAARELQVHLSAGALPVNVDIVGSGQVPAPLGAMFKQQAGIAGLLALVAVSAMVSMRYRRREIILPMLATSFSEVLILLGFAAAVGWELDLPSVAGIITVIGTGIDQLVIITDETMCMEVAPSTKLYSMRLGNAFRIIFGAAATTIVAMCPLIWMGLGVLGGFAIVTVVGVLVGTLFTRPAYARILRALLIEHAR